MNATPAPAAVESTDATVKATAPGAKAPAKKASTKTPAKKATATKAPAKKVAPGKKVETPNAPTVADRDNTAYEGAINEWKELKRDITDHIAAIAYQARRATPSENYAKTHDEALAKLTSAVAAVRETARLLSEVAPKK